MKNSKIIWWAKTEDERIDNKKDYKIFLQVSEGNSFLLVSDKLKTYLYELLNITIISINDQFQSNVIDHLCKLEKIIIGEEKAMMDNIIIYGIDFNKKKCKLHRNSF